MTRTRKDRAKVTVYNIRAWWHRLGWFGQGMICAGLYALFILVAFPQFADLVERAVWGEVA